MTYTVFDGFLRVARIRIKNRSKTVYYQTPKDLFNDGSIDDPVNESSKFSIEPSVEPPVPEPVEFPIDWSKRNDNLDQFKSGPCYIDIKQVEISRF